MPAVLLILAFSIFPLIISVWLCAVALQARRRRLRGPFRLVPQFPQAAVRLRAVPFPRHLRPEDRWVGWAVIAITLALIVRAVVAYARSGRVSVLGCARPRHRLRAVRRACLDARLDDRPGRPARLARHHAVLCRLRACRAVHHRHRPRLALRAEDPRAQLLPRRLLHPADGDAGRHRLHLPDARRHDRRPVRAALANVRLSATSNGRPTSGRPVSSSCSARAGSGSPSSSS